MTDAHGTTQPFLHHLVSCVRAPVVVLSGADGQVRAAGAQGCFAGDTRVLVRCEVTVGGVEAEPLGYCLGGVGAVEFTGVLRRLGDPGVDPTVTLTRRRNVDADGMTETLCLRSDADDFVQTDLHVRLGVDLAAMDQVKAGRSPAALGAEAHDGGLRWRRGPRAVTARGAPRPVLVDADEQRLGWPVRVPARGEVEVTVRVTTTDRPAVPRFHPVPAGRPLPWATPTISAEDHRLAALVAQGLADVESLLLADPDDPQDAFVAAGSPWFLTLFGRDSLWAARMLLPLGTELARGTLTTLARRQGTRVDRATEEQPGKILHEVRPAPIDVGGGTRLPARYYGTVDATPLWVCLLAEAWRWGMPAEEVVALLPACEAALAWLVEHGDSGGFGGLVAYPGTGTGTGLANQAWKDSPDAVQWADGRNATGPLALCEVQGYAHQAAVAGADLLEAFGRPGTDRWRHWAERLRQRFRDRFWTQDAVGPFPALALDRDRRPVDSLTSNIGHLLGTGLLDASESQLVAGRLARADMSSGYGLRTLSAASPRYGPLTYHRGSVWPHDTAIVADGLAREGHAEAAGTLVAGLLEAATRFDHRLPELYGGTQRAPGRPLLAYPAACRPQAWAAAAAVSLLQTILGIRPDVPNGELTVTPLLPTVAGAVAARGLRVGGGELSVAVTRAGAVDVLAPTGLRVRTER